MKNKFLNIFSFTLFPFLALLLCGSCGTEVTEDKEESGKHVKHKTVVIDEHEDDSIVFWTEKYVLKWTDFRQPLNGTEEFDARTKTGITYRYSSNSRGYKVTVYTFLGRDSSYAKSDAKKSDVLLNHEKGHFDLAEIRTRIVREEMCCWNGTDNFPEFLERCVDQSSSDNETRQDDYDCETKHGLDTIAQARWNRFIDSMMLAHSGFSEAKIFIPAKSDSN